MRLRILCKRINRTCYTGQGKGKYRFVLPRE